MYLSPTTSCKLTIGDSTKFVTKIRYKNTAEYGNFKIILWFLKYPILRRQMNRYTLLEFFETIRFWLIEFCLFHAFLFSILNSKFFGISENFRN